MEIVLNDKQIQQIADKTANLVLRRLNMRTEEKSFLVNVREAARILGVSVTHMRSIKDEYPHIRRGSNQQGHIYFIKEALTASLPPLQIDNKLNK